MKFFKNIIYLLVIVPVVSYGQQNEFPSFILRNRITAHNDSPQIHSLWIGMKSPLKIMCSDPKVKFLIRAEGGTIVNHQENHEFDLIPTQREVSLFIVSPDSDTLNLLHLVSRNMISPEITLMIGEHNIDKGHQINKRDLTKLSARLMPHAKIERDLIELPDFSARNIEIILVRNKKKISSITSFSNLNSLKAVATRNDELIIIFSSYSYKDAFSKTITKNCTEVFKLIIK